MTINSLFWCVFQSSVSCVRKHNLHAKLDKCTFHTDTIKYLGFIVLPSGLLMDTAVRPSLGPMRDLVTVGGAAVGRRGSANYVGGCWCSLHIRCRKCAVGYAAHNASAHHKAVHWQQRHHRQRSMWRSDHNRLLGSGGSAAASVMSSEAQNAHGACGTARD